jgi:hypothetical protein
LTKILQTNVHFQLVPTVWPTTIEEIQDALERLLGEVPDAELSRALVFIDRETIRVRHGQ